MTETQEYVRTLVSHVCGECGVVFGMSREFYDARSNDHKTWYCPNGHPRAFTRQSEAEKLKQQLQWARADAQSWRDEAETAENRRRAQKAANTKLKKRIAAGICPCCHRNFQDLRRHMTGQHPDYTKGGE